MNDQKPKLDLMTLADVCLALQVSRRTAYRMISQGNLPVPTKVGNFRQLYWERADFEKACRKAMR